VFRPGQIRDVEDVGKCWRHFHLLQNVFPEKSKSISWSKPFVREIGWLTLRVKTLNLRLLILQCGFLVGKNIPNLKMKKLSSDYKTIILYITFSGKNEKLRRQELCWMALLLTSSPFLDFWRSFKRGLNSTPAKPDYTTLQDDVSNLIYRLEVQMMRSLRPFGGFFLRRTRSACNVRLE